MMPINDFCRKNLQMTQIFESRQNEIFQKQILTQLDHQLRRSSANAYGGRDTRLVNTMMRADKYEKQVMRRHLEAINPEGQ